MFRIHKLYKIASRILVKITIRTGETFIFPGPSNFLSLCKQGVELLAGDLLLLDEECRGLVEHVAVL